MKTFAITATFAALCVASSAAVEPSRKRTQAQRKSIESGRVVSDESYDPYLGMESRRKLDKMSMSMSMSMPTETTPTTPTTDPPMERAAEPDTEDSG